MLVMEPTLNDKNWTENTMGSAFPESEPGSCRPSYSLTRILVTLDLGQDGHHSVPQIW